MESSSRTRICLVCSVCLAPSTVSDTKLGKYMNPLSVIKVSLLGRFVNQCGAQ